MAIRETINRQLLIIRFLRQRAASFRTIQQMLRAQSIQQGYDLNISVRTFQRDCNDIASLYDVDIEFNPYDKKYHIKYEDQPEFKKRMLEAFDTVNTLRIGNDFTDYIHFESRQPRGTEHIHDLVYAIKNRLEISFLYEKFDEPTPQTRTIKPYTLKEFNSRWYLIGNETSSNRIKTYGLDRISDLIIGTTEFPRPTDFDYNAHFRNFFGITTLENTEPQDILLIFSPLQGRYIESMPLHHSQSVVYETDKWVLISLKMCITFEFVQELLSYGENLKVIQPKSLVDQLLTSAIKLLGNYNATN